MKPLLLLLLVFAVLECTGAQRAGLRRLPIKRPPKKRPTTRPKSISNPNENEDMHGGLGPGGLPEGLSVRREGCRAPDVSAGGAEGESWSSVQEVRFVGLVGRQRRDCKIKCLNGLWVGPICTEGGTTVKRIPRRCTLRLVDAELVGVTDEGRVLASDTEASLAHDALLRFRCSEPGLYKFVGNDSLQCEDGEWSSDPPHCIATTLHRNFSLQAPPTILYHVVSGDAGLAENGSIVVFPGTIINIDCLFQRQSGKPEWTWTTTHRQYPSAWAIPTEEKNWKFRLSIYYAKDYDSGTYTCVTPQDITNEVHILVKDVYCPAIKSVDHNRVMAVEGSRMHSKARFACVDGFELVGPEELTCQPSGLWSEEAPTCEVRKCPPLVLESKHLIASTKNRTYGTRVVFSCPTGFRLAGAPFLSCQKTANWSGDAPTCDPITCKPPVSPVNGRVLDTGRYLAGDFVQYTCNAGHVVVGESVAICTDHGVWSQQSPTCKAACEFPGEPSHGQVIPTKFHYDIGEVAVVGCRPGFRVLGHQQLRCTSSGHWSGPLPHCRPYLPPPALL